MFFFLQENKKGKKEECLESPEMGRNLLGKGGIIPVNLATGLTRNLKTSHEIFVGSTVLFRENKLLAKYHRNKVLVTRIKFLSQEIN